MDRVYKKFAFLVEKHNMTYKKQIFNKHLNGGFLGPFIAHSFYNIHGCFTIYYALQRNEYYFYISKCYSEKQNELLSVDITDEVYRLLKSHYPIYFDEISTLSKILKKEINERKSLFNIRLT